jgi:hypothetical protein
MYLTTKIKTADSRSGCVYTSGQVFEGIVIPAITSGGAGSTVDLTGYVTASTGTTAGYLPVFETPSNVVNSIIYQSGSTTAGKIGIGNATPKFRVHVLGSGATATNLHCYFPSDVQKSNAVVMQGVNNAYFVAHSEAVETVFGASVLGVGVVGTLDNSAMEIRTNNAKRICLTNTCTYITTPASISTSVISPIVCGSTCIKSPIVTGSTCVISPIVKTDALCSKTVPFISDPLTGQGFCVGSTGNAEFQNLRVNCAMYAREFVVDKMKTVSDLVIGNGGVCAVSGVTYYPEVGKFGIKVIPEDRFYAQPDDGLWSLQTDPNGTHSCFLRVYSGDSANCLVYVCDNWNVTKACGPGLVNVNANYFCNITPPGVFYQVDSNSAGQYVQSNLFKTTGGTLQVCHCLQMNNGNVCPSLYDCSGNLVCNFGTCTTTSMINCTIPVANCCYRMRYTLGTSSTSALIYYPAAYNTYAKNPPDVSGWEFALWGNKTNPARQNLIYITGTQSGAPKIELYTNVTGQTVTEANKKTVLNAEGLKACNACLIDANVSGIVCAGSGCIGGWNINSSGIEDNFINLNSQTHSISIADVNSVERIIIHNGNPTTVANMLCGSCMNITSCACLCPANITIQGCSGNLSCLTFYEQQTAGSNLAVDNYNSLCTTKRFTLCSGNTYANRIYLYAIDCYQLPTNTCVGDTCNWTCTEYSRQGNYSLCTSTCLLDNNNVVLRQLSCCVNTTPTNSDDYYSIGGLTLQNTLITGTSVYFKTNICRIDNVYTQRKQSTFLNCALYCSQCFNEDLNLCNTICINRINIASAVGKTEITPTSIQGIYCNNNGYRHDATANNFCFYSPVTACNISASNTITTAGLVLTPRTVTANATLANTDAFVIVCGASAAPVVYLPSVPVVGQMHIITNKSTAYSSCVCATCIFADGAAYTGLATQGRHSRGFVYTGNNIWSNIYFM